MSFNKRRGFTMIELLVVMAIVATLMTLVGPMTLNSINKAEVSTERLTLNNKLNKLSELAFFRGTPLVIELKDKQIKYNLSPNTAKTIVFEHISFKQQTFIINSRGFFPEREITVFYGNKKSTLVLNQLNSVDLYQPQDSNL